MLRRFRGRRFFAVFFLALALFALFFFLGNEGYRSPISRKTRKSLLIIGRGRSGTSFVSKMIASGNEIMEVYEPLLFYRPLKNKERLQVLQRSLNCKFTPRMLWRLNSNGGKHISQCIKNIPKEGRNCFPSDELVQKLRDKCKNNCFTVVKELTKRLPGKTMSSLLPLISDPTIDTDVRLLHVVRDPRASLNSAIKLGWMSDYKERNFNPTVQSYCEEIFQNIKFGQKLKAPLKHKYRLILYRDIAARPFDTAREIFKFVGLDLSQKTVQWILNMTSHKTVEAKKDSGAPYSLVRDSEANIDKWRSESPPERTRIIEKVCQPLLKLIEEISSG